MSRTVVWDRGGTSRRSRERGRGRRGREVTRDSRNSDNYRLILVKTEPTASSSRGLIIPYSDSSRLNSNILRDLQYDSIEAFLLRIRTYPWMIETRELRRDLLHDSIYCELRDLVERYLSHPKTSEEHRSLDIQEWMSPDRWSGDVFHDVIQMATLFLETDQRREERIQRLSRIYIEQPFNGFNLHVVLEFCGKIRNKVHVGADKGINLHDRTWIVRRWIRNLRLNQERSGENYLQKEMRRWLDQEERRVRDRRRASAMQDNETTDDDLVAFKEFVEELRTVAMRKNEEVRKVFEGLNQVKEYYFPPKERTRRRSYGRLSDYDHDSRNDYNSEPRKRRRLDDDNNRYYGPQPSSSSSNREIIEILD